jgi:hypothetical protein
MKTLWHNCHAASMANGTYSIIEDAVIVTEGAHIAWIGPRTELPDQGSIEARGPQRRLGHPRPDRLPHPYGVRRQSQR